jgi:hypothetical protein
VRGGGGALFPWRSSDQLLERLGADEFEQKGFLLGGNVVSSNPMFDAYATAYFFIGVPLHQMMFFKHWQEDMAENMSWAFSQGVGGILSNVYHSTYFGVWVWKLDLVVLITFSFFFCSALRFNFQTRPTRF